MAQATFDPVFAGVSAAIATLPGSGLSDDELQTASWLATRLFEQRPILEVPGLYYNGKQRMQDLGISIPPALAGLRTIVGWPRIGIDAIANRCRVEGFRYPGATDTDEDLWDIWQANNLDGESQLAHLEALIHGRAYVVVGVPADDDSTDGQPLITVESPMNMTATWDAQMRRCTSALQIFLDTDFTSDTYGQEVASLYLLNSTIVMGRLPVMNGAQAKWEIVQRDDHNLNRVPVVRMANRARISERDGRSEITDEWRNTTDSTCRTLLGMEVTREFYAAPRRYILGAAEEDFKRSDGTQVPKWEAYVSKIWAVSRDEDGNVPEVGEFASSDPATFTKMIDEYAKIMAGEMGVPPHFLGVYSDGNPASADAIRSGYEELTIRVRNKHVQFSEAWEEVMRIALLIRDGVLPDGAHRMETDWRDPSPSTPASTSTAIYQQVEGGMIPPTSDVTLGRLGYTPAERARLAADRDADEAAQFESELAHSLIAKEAKVDTGLVKDIGSDSPPGVPVPTDPQPATPPANG